MRARGLSAEVLQAEPRNAAHDPADAFSYILFAWGNCQAGDRLVTERALGHPPTDEELRAYIPGVRFYFRYDRLIRHPAAVMDGALPLRIRDEVALADWVDAIIAPAAYRARLAPRVPAALRERMHYLPHEGESIWSWAEGVYEQVACGFTPQ